MVVGVCVFQRASVSTYGLALTLVGFSHRRRSKQVLELGELLSVVATALARHHIGFCLPQENGDALAVAVVRQQAVAFVSLYNGPVTSTQH